VSRFDEAIYSTVRHKRLDIGVMIPTGSEIHHAVKCREHSGASGKAIIPQNDPGGDLGSIQKKARSPLEKSGTKIKYAPDPGVSATVVVTSSKVFSIH
jgi:hypothetical protein